MDQKIDNRLRDCNVEGDYVGGNQTKNYYISMFKDSEREFVVTHNANIKPVSYFTGRETELQELRQRIEDGRKSVLVSGMGGIGKTHICRKLFEEYTNKHANSEDIPFCHIGYIEYNGDMGSSLRNCLKFKKQDSPEQNLKAAWRELDCLASDGKLLLFVDNVNESIASDPGLERLKHIPGAIILTSRRTSFSKEFEPYRIGFLSTEQCRKIYERIRFEDSGKRVNKEDLPVLEYIIDKLAARHTITVEFLAHLAQTKHWTIQRLRDELEKNGFRLEYTDEEDILVNIQKSYETLYDLSVLTKAEQNILEAFSVFPYIPLSAEICNQWLLGDAGVSEDDDILNGLYRKGWLQLDIVQESYAVHPVFAQVIYDKTKPNIKNHSGLIEACQNDLDIPRTGSALQCQQYIPFAESIIEKIDTGNIGKIDGLLFNLAFLSKYIADYEKAEKLYRRIIQISEKSEDENYFDISKIYNNLADVYQSMGEYEKAKELFNKSLKMCEENFGKDHSDFIKIYSNIAALNWKQGEYEKAKEQFERICDICKEKFGTDHPDTAKIYCSLAVVYESQGEYEKAEELYGKSLRICQMVFGKKHPETISKYNNLGSLYRKQGKYEDAEKLIKNLLTIYEDIFGKNHPNTATIYNNLATVYESEGEYEKAKELYKKSLKIRVRLFEENHSCVADSYNNLAGIYRKQGEYKKSKELYEKSLTICEKTLGENHPNTIRACNNLAVMCECQGDYDKSDKLYKKSLDNCKRVFGENHPDTANIYNNFAYMLENRGESCKALNYLFYAYKIYFCKFGFDHPGTKHIYLEMKLIYSKCKSKDKFEQWLDNRMQQIETEI